MTSRRRGFKCSYLFIMARVGLSRQRQNLRSDMASAAMSSRSSASASLPASHRFDLLIAEQRSLVYSAQQTLQQSLSVLQGSSAKSKEEQESLQCQVQTALDRAEELIVKLQVVDKIRNECSHIQQKLIEAKKAHENVDDLHARLRWLEQRLEGLLLARRRGRPAAHGKRAMRGTRTQGRGGFVPVMEPSPWPRSVPESGSLDSRYEGLSDRFTTNTKSTSVYQSQGLSQTVTRSVSQDSDVWHSESEANWTMVHTTKDITQSQVLSEDDKLHEDVVYDCPRLKTPGHRSPERSGVESTDKEEKVQPNVEESSFTEDNIYGFEPQRSSQIFGHNSWNTLTLAVNTNYYAAGSNEVTSAMLNLPSLIMLQTGLSRLCSEIDSLKVLVQTASKAAAQPGPLLSVKNQDRVGSFKRPRSMSEPLKLTLKTQTVGRETLVRFPSIEDVKSDCSKLHPSHRLYGQKSSSYPRSSGAWTSNQVPSKAQSDSTSDVYLSQSILSPQWRRQRLRSTRSRSSRRKSAHQSTYDIFDVEGHRQRCVEHLCRQLKSTVVETRIDSVQALGLLKDGTKEVTDNLLSVLDQDTDCRVKYEAVKSLLLLGVFNEMMLHFVYSYLKLGSTSVQADLLQLLSQDTVLCLFIHETEPSIQLLYDVLTELISDDDSEVSLYSAVVLCHLNQQQDDSCVKKFRDVLETSNQQHQSMALHCLIKCCGCCDDDVISSALTQMEKLSNWKLRLSAVEDLKYIGKDLLNYQDEKGQDVFNILLKMIIREPIRTVRMALGQLLYGVGLARKAETVLYGRLSSSKEITRGEAVGALGAFDGLQSKTIQALLECLELDPSSYVRIQGVRTLAQMKTYNRSVVKCIAEKSRGHDMLARECTIALQSLEKRFGLA